MDATTAPTALARLWATLQAHLVNRLRRPHGHPAATARPGLRYPWRRSADQGGPFGGAPAPWVGPSRAQWIDVQAELDELRAFRDAVATAVEDRARWVPAQPRPGEYRIPEHRRMVVVGHQPDSSKVTHVRRLLLDLQHRPQHLAAA